MNVKRWEGAGSRTHTMRNQGKSLQELQERALFLHIFVEEAGGKGEESYFGAVASGQNGVQKLPTGRDRVDADAVCDKKKKHLSPTVCQRKITAPPA